MATEKILAAGIIVFTHENNQIRYLLLLSAKGHWDFAKGRLEPHETVEQAALREVYEETGLTISGIDRAFQESISYDLEYHNKRYKKTVTYFVSQAYTTEITLSDEHDGFIWCSLEKALNLLSHKESKDILTKANQYIMKHML